MESVLKVFEYEGSPIQFEVIDGQVMANATSMAKAFPKKNLSQWIKRKQTKEYINALKAKNPVIQNYITVKQGGNNKDSQGTWIHEKLILDLARWLNTSFAVWCDEKLSELIRTGNTSLESSIPEEWKAILPHTSEEVQKDSSKSVNGYNIKNRGIKSTIEWNVKNVQVRTKNNMRPSELREWAKKEGIPSKYRKTGKDVVRYCAPHKASAMSVADMLLCNGISEEEALKTSIQLEEPFLVIRKALESGKKMIKPF